MQRIDAVQKRSGRWFDPELVKAAVRWPKQGSLWTDLTAKDLIDKVLALEPEQRRMRGRRRHDRQYLPGVCRHYRREIAVHLPAFQRRGRRRDGDRRAGSA